MQRTLTFAAFGWLAFGGIAHFGIDVVSQYLRAKRVPGPETTLYFGLNTAYALGQILFAALALLALRAAPELFTRWPALALSFAAALAWLAVTFLFMEYREPRVMVGIFAALIAAAAVRA